MRRVCKPSGWVAARDADYAAMTWFPSDVAPRSVASVVRRAREGERRGAGCWTPASRLGGRGGSPKYGLRPQRGVSRPRVARLVGWSLGRSNDAVGPFPTSRRVPSRGSRRTSGDRRRLAFLGEKSWMAGSACCTAKCFADPERTDAMRRQGRGCGVGPQDAYWTAPLPVSFCT